jgi:uncharacterized protein YbjT (DUF2867 family)
MRHRYAIRYMVAALAADGSRIVVVVRNGDAA